MRPSSIVSSEARVQKLVQVLQQNLINPFDVSLNKDELYNLSSGCPVSKDVCDKIPAILPNGKDAHKKFVTERLESTKTKFHDSLKRIKIRAVPILSVSVLVSAVSAILESFVIGKIIPKFAVTADT